MEQMELNKEKEELMERIKATFAGCIFTDNKWWILLYFISTITVALIPFFLLYDEITEGGFGFKQITCLIFCVLYAVTIVFSGYRNVVWKRRIAQCETAQSLLENVDRNNKEYQIILAVLLVVLAEFVVSLLLDYHEMVWAIIVGVLMVALAIYLIFSKPRMSKDAKRLKELVEMADGQNAEAV